MDTIAIRNTVARERQAARQTSFTGMEDHRVTLSEAARLTHNFRAQAAGAVKAGYFGRGIIEKILGQEESAGIRVYNAKLESGAPTFVLCGVTWYGDELYTGILAEESLICPPWCPWKNALNSDQPVFLSLRGRRTMFSGDENHSVTLAQASVFTRNFRESSAEARAIASYFSRKIFADVLNQTGCVGVRFYFARTDDGASALVLVGAEADGSDITSGVIGKGILRAAQNADSPNPLNQ